MMTRFILLSVLVMSCILVKADSKQDKSLQLLKSMMPKECHFSGAFSQSKQIASLPVPLVSKGEFIFSCDFGLIWKTQEPIVETLVFTKKNIHFLIPEKLPIENLEGVQHDFLANLLLSLMSGNGDFIVKEFDLVRTVDTKNSVTLKPKNKMVKQAIQSVILKRQEIINGLEIIITDKNQQETKIMSTEKQQLASNDDFSKACVAFVDDNCKLLLNPVRINSSGKN